MLYAKKNIHKYKKKKLPKNGCTYNADTQLPEVRGEQNYIAAWPYGSRLTYTRSQVQFPRLPINKHALSVKRKVNEDIIL